MPMARRSAAATNCASADGAMGAIEAGWRLLGTRLASAACACQSDVIFCFRMIIMRRSPQRHTQAKVLLRYSCPLCRHCMSRSRAALSQMEHTITQLAQDYISVLRTEEPQIDLRQAGPNRPAQAAKGRAG